MKRERMEYRKPYGRGDYELHRGHEGIYWQAGNGVLVRLAAAERHPERHTECRVSPGEAFDLEDGSAAGVRA